MNNTNKPENKGGASYILLMIAAVAVILAMVIYILTAFDIIGGENVIVFKMAAVGTVFASSVICAVIAVSALRASKKPKLSVDESGKYIENYTTDDLTGVCTLRGFIEESRRQLSAEPGKYFILDYDVADFSGFNRKFGPDTGDRLIKTIAEVTLSISVDLRLIGRVYADRFLSLCRADSAEAVRLRFDACCREIRARMTDQSLKIYCGVYEISDAAMSMRDMIDCAAVAKRRIKLGGSDESFMLYDADEHRRDLSDAEEMSYLEAALNKEEFITFYQPKYGSVTEHIVGAEALVRWMHPNRDVTTPNSFIALFEKYGLISKLDMYIAETVCSKLRSYIDMGLSPVPISINFSGFHLGNENFINDLVTIADKYSLPHALIEAEFSEAVMLREPERIRDAVYELKRQGCRVAIDAFEAREGSFERLSSLPVDTLKFGRVFIREMSSGSIGEARFAAAVKTASRLPFVLAAEGVETAEQLAYCREAGFKMIQGYYYSMPVNDRTFDKLLEGDQNR